MACDTAMRDAIAGGRWRKT